jgi:hypothetical protein
VALGAVFIYAGLRGVTPLQALRDAASGKPPPVVSRPTVITSLPSSSGLADRRRESVVAAAQKYVGDIYSQPRRRQPGYSDCSSFVDKALTDAGISPPFGPWANTANFRISPQWRTIPANQVWPGDIAISATHMVLITGRGGTSGIGQQRPGVNVRTGDMRTLFGSQSFVFKTYTGYTLNPDPAKAGSHGSGGGSW